MASTKRHVRWLVAVCALFAGFVVAAPAYAASPWWSLYSTARPVNLPPGGEGTIVATVVNVGDEATSGAWTLSDTLPAGLTAQSVAFVAGPVGHFDVSFLGTCETTPGRVQCVYPSELPVVRPFEYVEMAIRVKVAANAVPGTGHVAVTGGGAADVSQSQPLVVSSAPTPFGVENFRFIPEDEGGAVDTRAGSHPFQLSAIIGLNQTDDLGKPPALPRDLRFQLPAGFVGNATSVPQCSEHDFSTIGSNGASNFCPADTAIGVGTVNIFTANLETRTVPLFNLVPRAGEPARFGFEVVRSPVVIDTSVRSGRDYGVTASSTNITQLAGFLSAQLAFWGVPADPRHDKSRGWNCIGEYSEEGQPCVPSRQSNHPPFLTLPTACEGPLTTTVEGISWPNQANPDGEALPPIAFQPVDSLGHPANMTGCDQLPFSPSITVTPETHAASTPTGVDVHVHLPQDTTSNASGLAEAAIRDATVTLPEGMVLNPSGAGGLVACSEGLVGFQGFGGDGSPLFTPEVGEPFCPDASKVGTVRIKIPLIANPLEGAVYVASQNANPFGSLIALYFVARDPVSGVLVKFPGKCR